MVNNNNQPTVFYEVYSVDSNNLNEDLEFSNTMDIIDSFSIIGQAFEIPNYTPSLSNHDRVEFDSFSVYNKHTTSLRCEIPGTGENEGWCFDAFVEGSTHYISQLLTMEESNTIKYRAWLPRYCHDNKGDCRRSRRTAADI